MHSIIIREIGAQAPRDLLGTPMRPQSCANVCEQAGPVGSSRAWVVWAVRAHLLGAVRLVHAGRGIRVAHQLAAGGRRGTIERARDPAHAHAGLPPVGDADALVLAQIPRTDLWGMSTVERYQSTDGFSFLPFDRVLPLRHTLPVRLDTPTARAACVKFMPASRCSTYRRRRAAHISPRVAYSTPSNTHLSTWPSHQSARRCDDQLEPALRHFFGGRDRWRQVCDGSRMHRPCG